MVAVLRKLNDGCMIPAKVVAQERLAKWKGECAYIHGLTLVIKNSYTYCKNLEVIKAKYYVHAPRGIDW